MPNFIQIEETFCGRTDRRTFETHTLLGRLGGVDLKIRVLNRKCKYRSPSELQLYFAEGIAFRRCIVRM